MEQVIERLLSEDQFGFRRGQGTREAILTLRQVIEKQNRKMKTTYIAFVDLEIAFDNVKWRTIFNILERAEATYKDRRIIKSLHEQEI